MYKKIKIFLLLILTCTAVNSCYRMPDPDEYSMIPSTNNPEVTRQRQGAPIPQVSY